MQHLVVVRGDAPEATAAMADSLGGDLVLWDEADHHQRWVDHPSKLEVRAIPSAARAGRWLGPGAEQRTRQLVVRAHLARRRSTPIVVVGSGALGVAAWLTGHRGPRCWVPTTDDLDALLDGLAPPGPDEGGPAVVAVVDDLVAERRRLERVADARWHWLPGWHPSTDGPPVDQRARGDHVLAIGPADRPGGLDLVVRALAAARIGLDERGARLTWLLPPGTVPDPEDVADLRRAGVDHLVAFVEADRPAGHPLVRTSGAVVLPGRAPHGAEHDLVLSRAFAAGSRFVATDRWVAPAPGLAGSWSTAPFGDGRATGAALLAALDAADRLGPPGPFGPLGLFEVAP